MEDLPFLLLVGAKGFEPSTPCSRSRCATRLRYAPTFFLDKPGERITMKSEEKQEGFPEGKHLCSGLARVKR